MRWRSGARAAGVAQHARVALEPLGDLRDRQHGHARGGELDRQRHPVEPPADPAERSRAPRARPGSNRLEASTRALDEQRDRAVVRRPASCGRRLAPVARPRPPTRHTCSPGTPSGWRLVAITRSDGERSSRLTTRSAHPSTTCSQLSSTSSVDSGKPRASAAGAGSCVRSRSRMVAATAWGTSRARACVDRSTHQAPPTKSGRIASASAIASRVLPAPPGPHRVSTRVRQTSERSSARAASRPTSLVSWTGRFPSAPVALLARLGCGFLDQSGTSPVGGIDGRCARLPTAHAHLRSLKTGAGGLKPGARYLKISERPQHLTRRCDCPMCGGAL